MMNSDKLDVNFSINSQPSVRDNTHGKPIYNQGVKRSSNVALKEISPKISSKTALNSKRKISEFGENFARIEDFVSDLGLTIPDRFSQDPYLQCTTRDGTFFSTDREYNIFAKIQKQMSFDQMHPTSRKILKNNPYFLGFGQSGHGFNSYQFNVYYADPKLNYFFSCPFGGVFEGVDDVNEARLEVNKAFNFLDQLIDNDSFEDDAIYYINYDNDPEAMECQKFNIYTNEWMDVKLSDYVDFIW